MQRERKEGVDFLRSCGNEAGGIFLQLQFKSALSVLQRGRGGKQMCYICRWQKSICGVSVKCVGVDG